MNPMPFANRRKQFQTAVDKLSGRYELYEMMLSYDVSGQRRIGQWLTSRTTWYFRTSSSLLDTEVTEPAIALAGGLEA